MKSDKSNKTNKPQMESHETHPKSDHLKKSDMMHESDTKTKGSTHSKMEKDNSLDGWLNETKDVYIGMFEKQLKDQYAFYNTLMNSISETSKNTWKPGMNVTNLFWKNNPMNMDLLSDGEAMANYYNLYGKTITTMLNQVIDFDQKLFDVLSKEMQYSEKDWNRSGEILKNALENRLNASKNMMRSNMEMLNKQKDNSIGKNKKHEEEMYA